MDVVTLSSTVSEALAALCLCGAVGLVAQRILGIWIKPTYYGYTK